MADVHIDEIYMSRALDLAEKGRGAVSPNPLVGCVIVKDGAIIAEGYHKKFGGPHAEVEAINSLQDKSQLTGAELYVNLEPCSHHGKTPPCADLITQFSFQRVIIANKDSNPQVSGKGISRIKSAGIEVTENILSAKARKLNNRFFTFMEKKRPFVLLKWAQTADGFIARKDFTSKWISNVDSRRLVHKWRSEEDSIMVGTNTVLVDNPKLNVRDWEGRNPVRVFLDRKLRVRGKFNLLDKSQLTICYNEIVSQEEDKLLHVKINFDNMIEEILQDLYDRNIQSVMVEGGKFLLDAFIQSDRWDEIRLFKSNQRFEEGLQAPEFSGTLVDNQEFEDDILEIYEV